MNTTETITVAEVGSLLEQLVARDQRTTGKADVIAWWNDLNTAQISYRDAQQAANYYYAVEWPRQKPQERYRLTPPATIELVRKVHKERLENFVYQPSGPDETGAEFVENYNRQLQAVATGARPPVPSITQALKPQPVAELIAGVAAKRVLPPEIAEVIERRRPAGTSVRCPACNAQPGERCRAAGTTRQLGRLHPSRLDAYATAVAQCPRCEAAPGDGCTEYGQPYRGGAHRDRIEAAGAA